jgi:hypothetical protein
LGREYWISRVALPSTLSNSLVTSSGRILEVLMPFTLQILSPGTSCSLVKATEPGRKEATLGHGSSSEFPSNGR